MTHPNWLALADRAEKATGADRELDCLIAIAIGDVPAGYERHDAFTWIMHRYPSAMNATYTPAYFTDSIDAMIALIKQELPNWDWRKRRGNAVDLVFDGSKFSDFEGPYEATAATLALALVAAFCRAKHEKERRDAKG